MTKVAVGAFVLAAAASAIKPAETARLNAAEQVVTAIRGTVPLQYAGRARCVAVIPELKRAAFDAGGDQGKGVISCRSGDGWSAPVFLRLAKGSWRAQISGEIVDLVMLVMNERGVQQLLENKVTLGADASVAAGPVGGKGQVGTDALMTAGILSYSRAGGLFAGVDVSGGVLLPDDDANHDAYGPGASPRTILATRAISAPVQANGFLNALVAFSPDVTTAQTEPAAAAGAPGSPLGAQPSVAPSSQYAGPIGIDADIRARIVSMQQTLDRLLSEAAPASVGTTGAASGAQGSAGIVTVDRARLVQLRQQLEALIAVLDRKQQS
jgi:lipid-binding SYLF domain-containing protein